MAFAFDKLSFFFLVVQEGPAGITKTRLFKYIENFTFKN